MVVSLVATLIANEPKALNSGIRGRSVRITRSFGSIRLPQIEPYIDLRINWEKSRISHCVEIEDRPHTEQ